MAGFRVDFFKGLRPRISAKKLQIGESQTAENTKLGSGDLEPLYENATEQALNKQALTIYKYDNGGTPIWLEWEDRVSVAKGPIKGDSLERIYYTGDTTGNGAPKVTTNELADADGAAPYPNQWRYVGVPAPTVAPTVAPPALPEDKEAADRFASNFRTLTLDIDRVRYVDGTYPGTGTDNDTWRPNASTQGAIFFDMPLGTAFRVTSVDNSNIVQLENATEPGITMRTINADKTTINDWQAMDEQGSTKEAEFIGWRVPPNMKVKIAQHNLSVGDVITVTATSYNPIFYMAATQDFYAQDWETELTVEESGTTYYEHYDATISRNLAATSHFGIQGSFYYDVDRASSDVSELEDRTYVYTYVNAFGEEGPPSPPSTSTPCLDGTDVLISGMEMPPTIGYDITKMRLYRTNSTEAGTEFQFVKEFDAARSTRDTVRSEDLAEIIPSTSWDPPPTGMQYITTMPNGMMVGFKDKNIYFCEPYFPHAWPADYDQAIDHNIKGAAVFGKQVAVLTDGWPYIISGTHPRNASVQPIKVNQACADPLSIASDGDRVYYASPDGLVEIAPGAVKVVTKRHLDKEDWQTYLANEKMVGGFYEGKYYGFYDYNIAAVDPVITAEISGTITNADSGDIVGSNPTIIITLTNDEWVASGTAFDNQRQNIINGLTSSTNPTLGWNNLVRDDGDGDGLQVTDVVRTSDTVVTITLPGTARYTITSNEVITCTIPGTALVLSSSNLPAASTFTIIPKEFTPTVTLSGTVDGVNESSIVSGGNTIIITLTDDTWEPVATLTSYYQELVDGIKATTNEKDGWNDTVPNEIDISTDIARTSDTVLTITLPAVADYNIADNETISLTVPHEMLVTKQNIDVPASNSLGILATGAAAALFSGTAVSGGVTENEIVAGGDTIIITLTNETWVAAGTGPIGSSATSDAILAALLSDKSETNGWEAEVLANFVSSTDLVRTSNTVATITIPANANYSISENETISMTIPAAALTGAAVLAVSNTFGITAQDPVTAVITGSLVTGSPEAPDIVAGGETLIITLSSDTWKAAGTGPIGSTADTQAIIDGIDSAQAEGTGWDAVVKAGLTPATDVVRTSDTVCTITLPAFASYAITADETITCTVPAAAMNISASPVVASPTFQVVQDAPTTATITGTLDGGTSRTITGGSSTIIITLDADTWVTSGATFNAQRQNIIDGLDAASSPTTTTGGGWNDRLRDFNLDVTDVVRTSDTVVTITVPQTSTYDIKATENITVTIPASALTQSSIAVVGDQTVDITPYDGSTSRWLGSYADNTASNNVSYGVLHNYDISIAPASSTLPSTDDYFIISAAYSESLDLWVECHTEGPDTDQVGNAALYTAPGSDPLTETVRTSNFSFTTGGNLYWSTTFSYFFRMVDDGYAGMEYSSNGTSWSDGTSAIENPSTNGTCNMSSSTPALAIRNQVMYGGSQYVYGILWDGTANKNVLVRSADLSGASTPGTNWTNEVSSTFASGTDYYGSFGTGNGLILHIGYNGVSDPQSLEYMSHGGTSFSAASGSGIPQIDSGAQASTPYCIRYGADGIWLALNNAGKGIYCDTGSGVETNSDNWSSIDLSTIAGSGSGRIQDVWYDYGDGTDDGQGWIIIAYTPTSMRAWKLTGADISNIAHWTNYETYTNVSLNAGYMFPSHPIDGTALD